MRILIPLIPVCARSYSASRSPPLTTRCRVDIAKAILAYETDESTGTNGQGREGTGVLPVEVAHSLRSARILQSCFDLVDRPCTLVRLVAGLPPDTRLLPAWVTKPRPGVQTQQIQNPTNENLKSADQKSLFRREILAWPVVRVINHQWTGTEQSAKRGMPAMLDLMLACRLHMLTQGLLPPAATSSGLQAAALPPPLA